MARFTDPTPYPPAWLEDLRSLVDRWQGGDAVTQAEIDASLALWRERLQRSENAREEWFDIVDATGDLLGLTAPRWFAHLTGLRHRVVHVLLTSPQGLLALQVRSHRRPDWPNRLTTTAAGHLKAGQGWLEGAFSEIEEEIGLRYEDRHRWLAEGTLIPVGGPYLSARRIEYHPALLNGLPLVDWQVDQIFTGALTAWGLGAIRFDDGEVDGVCLTPPEEVARLVQSNDERLAPNLPVVFPRWQEGMNAFGEESSSAHSFH